MSLGLGTVSSAEVSAASLRTTREILFTFPWITWLFYSTNMANKRLVTYLEFTLYNIDT